MYSYALFKPPRSCVRRASGLVLTRYPECMIHGEFKVSRVKSINGARWWVGSVNPGPSDTHPARSSPTIHLRKRHCGHKSV